MALTRALADHHETDALGRRLADLLFPNAVLALVGDLGAGKTYLCRAIAVGLGTPDPRAVNSPTFVLIQEYDARLPLFHFDAYRLRDPQAFRDLGSHEYFTAGGVCLIEWADKVLDCLPEDHLRIELSIVGEQARQAHIFATGPRHAVIVNALSA